MKKIISFILVTAIMITISVPTYAAEKTENAIDMTNVFICNGHGEYILFDIDSNITENNELDSFSAENKITALPTVDEEIFKVCNSDKYLVLTANNKYLLSDKIDVDIQNFSNNIRVFEQYNISNYLKEDMQQVIEKQKELNNNFFTVELYAPALVVPEDNVSIMSIEPLGTQYYTYYYRGKNNNMKDYSVKYSNLNTGMIKKSGTSTLSTAKNTTSLVISSASIVCEVVNVFGTYANVAISAYDLFKSLRGEVVTGTGDDYISTNLIYSRIVKETYAQDSVSKDYPNAGCVSHKVWLDHNETYQYYRTKGTGELTNTQIKKEIYTKHFKNPAPTAIDNGISTTHYDLPLTTSLYGKTVKFVGN